MSDIILEIAEEEKKEIISTERTTFTDLLNSAMSIQKECTDYNVSFDKNSSNPKLRFNGNKGTLSFIPDILLPDQDSAQSLPMSRHAMGQLCTKLGVPVRYIEKCLRAGMPDLAEDNLNYWIENFDRSLFIRKYDNHIRGILSDRFSVLDAPDVIQVLGESVPTDEYTIKGNYFSPERFHVRVFQKEMLKIKGEDLFAGFEVNSSDVGRSTLSIRFSIFKQVCTNGLCIAKESGTIFDQKHMGIHPDMFRKGVQDALSLLPELITLFISRLEVTRSNPVISSIDLKGIISNPNYMDFHLSNQLKQTLTKEEIRLMYEAMNDSYDNTQWGLVNAITYVARDYSLERRLYLERAAGDIFNRNKL